MSAVLAPAVVGRSTELAALRAALDTAVAGRGSAVLLTGEAGVGKTRLLREVRRWAGERGAASMVGRAVDTATAVPYRPLVEALMAVFRGGVLAYDSDVAPFRDTLARLVPGLGDPSGPAPPVLHVAECFLRVARSRGERGTVVLLDDLQWADAETLAVVEYLADNVVEEPVLVVAASRPDDAGGVPPSLRGVVDRRAAQVLALRRLGEDEVVAMTRACLRDPAVPAEVLRLVAARADGLPFLVEELLAGLVHDGALVQRDGRWAVSARTRFRPPGTFAESVRRRLDALTAGAREVLLDAALLGRRLDPDLLARIGGAASDEVASALDAGLAQGLLETDDLGIRFRHTLTRDALLTGLSPHEHRAQSVRVLTGLRVACPVLPDELAEVAADLAEAAGELGTAAELLLDVGRRAVAQGALISAESAQRRALVLAGGTPIEIDARESLVVTVGLAGRAGDAFPLGEVLLASLVDLDPDGTRRAAVHLALAGAAVAATDWSLAEAHLTHARRLGTGDRVRERILDAVVAMGRYHLDDADRLAAAAVAAAEGCGDANLLCEALFVHGRCVRMRDLDAAARVFARARDTARAAGLVHREARALAELGSVEAHRGGDEELLREACRLAEGCGALETEAVAYNVLCVGAWFRGDAAGVLAHATKSLALARRYGLGQLIPAILIMLASGYALRGDRASMEGVLAEAEPLIGGEPTELIAAHAHARALCAFAHEEADVAAAELARAAEIADRRPPTTMPPLVGMHAVVHALAGNDPAELVASFRSRRHDTSPQLAALLLAAEAVHLGRIGSPTEAGAAAERALQALAANPFLQALTARLIAPAAIAAGWGDPARWLSAALAVFVERGLAAPAEVCRTAMSRVAVAPDGQLTAREREVLDLVADGLPNKAIAGRLYLSHRTVEKHVERLLAKTGSANRAQLATYALRRAADT
jgi:DNA-binding NarL/FixJ family response regulator